MELREIVKDIIGGAKRAKPYQKPTKQKPMTTMFEPATPDPRYICQNCGMLINTGHKHSREECQDYLDDPTKPDLGTHRVVLPGRNDPKVRLPYCYDSSR